MGNHASQENPEQEHKWPVRVQIGIMCFDFVPCKHFVHVEGIPGWAVYDSITIAKCFINNPEHFTIDSKYMPELGIARPDSNHFEMYKFAAPEDPDKVLQMHASATKHTTSEG
jgi:hypothetical protein